MRILIVEDQLALQRSLARALRDESYAVDTASDGDDGLFKARSYEYDAVVLDVMLPGIDGWGVLRQLRESGGAVARTPVLMLTARDSTDDRVRGLDTGADDYLTKPFELPELLARLRSLIRRSSGDPATAIGVGDFVVDFNAKKVLRDGRPVAVTAREFSLVEYLARHRGRVISRTQLYDHLFDEEDATLSNLLDVHVSRIRRKLGRNFITTHRGQGYSID